MTDRLSRRTTLKAGVAVAAAGLVPAPLRAATTPKIKLRILETTDLHVAVFPYDYYRDKGDDTMGLARTAAVLAAARAEATNALLFDNGDVIQGNPMGDYMAYQRGLDGGAVHPIVKAMNLLSYDCGTMGNHEFNYGLDYLGKAMMQGANFPLVCANLLKPDGSTYLPPYKVLERTLRDEAGGPQPVRIGVIGFVPPQIMQWDQGHLAGHVTTTDIVDAARKFVPQLRKEGAEIVVALCHSGIAGGTRAGGEENAALFLAEVPGIDVILTGHQHLVFPGPDFAGIDGVDAERGTLHGIPAVMAGFWGSHLGVIDLDLEHDGTAWKVAGFKSEARPIYDRKDRKVTPRVDSRPDILAAAQPEHDATLAYVRQPVGEITAPITSFFSLVADDPSVQIVSRAQLWYIGPLLAGTAAAGLPLLSAAAPFKAGGRGGPDYYTSVPAGPIAIKNVADLYLYPNTVRAVRISGAIVREWLERSAGIFNRIDPAKTEEQPLIDTSFPSYNFDVIDGVTYRIDLSQASRYDGDGKLVAPDAHRITDLQFQGKPIDEKQEFVVATNNYRAGGGGSFPGLDGKNIVITAPDTNRDVLVRYIHEQGRINPTADGNWSFAPLPKTVVVTFPSAPAAAQAVPAGLTIEPAGDAGDGFAKYRLVFGG
ncbi:2',3'-cyclic-nucleotide 2'-phosphodiesterase/3'-nucleotidase [Inquilinus ginsengisoli]|uniref:2',3'-cyclic-nucleotide 2'-phosphodiesterase/3'-nucleotidase n=1 Tax=Inquilinus ginsengisoli TaxID=363840 RepID=A0ABU1JUS7_9PROT|nr:bifunctional 2',3'-cyclic-nucleotide 2'-phosphodiesterase/3'-nucleotidase [Inquilinus ginsengisoli]MDR6292058.1 2',3'-cyclic-nucleotide 2'-phosphodiesterase/3'-nucleotidase [Inquilinus ginsengisoli]